MVFCSSGNGFAAPRRTGRDAFSVVLHLLSIYLNFVFSPLILASESSWLELVSDAFNRNCNGYTRAATRAHDWPTPPAPIIYNFGCPIGQNLEGRTESGDSTPKSDYERRVGSITATLHVPVATSAGHNAS